MQIQTHAKQHEPARKVYAATTIKTKENIEIHLN